MRFELRRMAVSFAAVLILFGTLGCSTGGGGGSHYVPADVPREKDGLRLVTDSNFDREYVKPGLDLSRYDRVLLVPVEFVYTPRYKRSHRFDRDDGPDQMVPEERLKKEHEADLVRLRKLFRQALEKELGGAYQLADQPGSGVLSLSVGVVDLDLGVVDAGENSPDQRAYGLAPVIKLTASLRDGVTGEELVQMLKVSQSHHDVAQSSAGVLFWGDIRDAFAAWARAFRLMLDHAREPHAGTPGRG